MEGKTSKIKKLASVERLNLNMSDPMNANLSSIFIEIKRNHDKQTLQEARKLVSTKVKIGKEYSHLGFNHACKSKGVLLKSLRFRSP